MKAQAEMLWHLTLSHWSPVLVQVSMSCPSRAFVSPSLVSVFVPQVKAKCLCWVRPLAAPPTVTNWNSWSRAQMNWTPSWRNWRPVMVERHLSFQWAGCVKALIDFPSLTYLPLHSMKPSSNHAHLHFRVRVQNKPGFVYYSGFDFKVPSHFKCDPNPNFLFFSTVDIIKVSAPSLQTGSFRPWASWFLYL